MRRRLSLLWQLPLMVVFVLVLGALPCAAYPISPAPLWELVQKSDLIVLAKVSKVETVEPNEKDGAPRWISAIARLEVKQVWKGGGLGQGAGP